MTKSRGLILIIIVLLISNLVAWFMLFSKKNTRPERRQQVREFLKNEVIFSNSQLHAFDSLTDSFRARARSEMGKLRQKRSAVMSEVMRGDFSDSILVHASNEIANGQRNLEYLKLKQTSQIRRLCTQEQLPKFDEGYLMMLNKPVPAAN